MKSAAIESLHLVLFFYFSFCISITFSVNEDGLSLLALKSAISLDPKQSLSSWNESDSSPCSWFGITCDPFTGKVVGISLPGKNLAGYIPSEIGALPFLTSLDLSENSFSGPLPSEIVTLTYLSHLDLSSNSFNGTIPEGLSNLTHLTGTLNLSYNAFSGEIPASLGALPVMLCFDFSHNNLTGKVPETGSLLNQGPTAFSGNPYLCGFPLTTPCTFPAEAQNPALLSTRENHRNPVISNRKPKDLMMIIAVIFGFSLLVALVSLSTWAATRKGKIDENKSGFESEEVTGMEERKRGRFVVVDEGFEMGLEDLLRASAYVLGKSKSGIVYKVVVGRGKAGGDSVPVAVRRLSETEGDGGLRFREFENVIEAITRVQHPNIVKLKAYYYSKDEKFLVSEFIKMAACTRPSMVTFNASSFSVKCNQIMNNLCAFVTAGTGNVNNSLPGTLTWAMRLRIAQEVANGLTHIHEFSNKKYIHGSLTSSKILLNDELKPFITGFGILRLQQGSSSTSASSSQRNKTTFMYIAPEALDLNSRLTQKCDVYSFGIVLLELLTGRFPDGGLEGGAMGLEGVVREAFREERRLAEIIDPCLLGEIDAKKQVVAMFHVALSCTDGDPDARPRMKVVSENLECIRLL